MLIAAGLGCRKGCALEDLVQAIERALVRADKRALDLKALYAPEFKRAEVGLARAAEHFGTALVFLPMAQLEAQVAHALSRSEQTLRRFGLPSVAETAALAGAVDNALNVEIARLLGPRQLAGGASCALATTEIVT